MECEEPILETHTVCTDFAKPFMSFPLMRTPKLRMMNRASLAG